MTTTSEITRDIDFGEIFTNGVQKLLAQKIEEIAKEFKNKLDLELKQIAINAGKEVSIEVLKSCSMLDPATRINVLIDVVSKHQEPQK